MPLLPWDQDDAEARLAVHHAAVSFSSMLQRSCFDHGTDILEHAETQRVLVVNGCARQCPVDRPSSKNERDRAHLDLILRYTHYNQLAAGCKTGHQWPHRPAPDHAFPNPPA